MSSNNWDALKTRLDGLERPTDTFTICPDPQVRQRRNQARDAVQEAEQLKAHLTNVDEVRAAELADNVKAAQTELAAAQRAFDKVAITLTFQALERRTLEDLEKQHPPSEEGEAAGEDFASTFPAALISAASVDGMPVDYAQHCLDTWSVGDARGLYGAALSVQRSVRTDLGKG